MIGSFTFAILTATLAATPCDSLKSISLPNVTITTSVLVPEGPPQAAGARGGAAPGGARGPAAAGPAAAPAAARGDGGGGGRGGGQPQSIPAHCRVVAVLKPSSGLLHQYGTLAAARG